MTQYLFYNPDPRGAEYDDVASMLESMPDDAIAVQFGWTPEIETARNALLAELGVSGISALPCVLRWQEEASGTDPVTGDPITIPAQWMEFRLSVPPQWPD